MAHKLSMDGYIAERAIMRPLLISPQKGIVLANFLSTRFGKGVVVDVKKGAWFDDEPSPAREKSKPYVVKQGVAIVTICGTLVQRGGYMDAESGLVSHDWIRNTMIRAAEDEDVKSILLDIDSGGGEVEGNFELARLIRQINDEYKPVVAVANGAAYSGAYSLAVAAGQLFVTETGGVGSVGVIIQHFDVSANNEMMGIKVTNITFGERKDELSSDFPLSPEGLKMLKDEVTRIGKIFVSHVATMRGISEKTVKETEATLLFGENAVNIGFVDGIASLTEVLAEMIEAE